MTAAFLAFLPFRAGGLAEVTVRFRWWAGPRTGSCWPSRSFSGSRPSTP